MSIQKILGCAVAVVAVLAGGSTAKGQIVGRPALGATAGRAFQKEYYVVSGRVGALALPTLGQTNGSQPKVRAFALPKKGATSGGEKVHSFALQKGTTIGGAGANVRAVALPKKGATLAKPGDVVEVLYSIDPRGRRFEAGRRILSPTEALLVRHSLMAGWKKQMLASDGLMVLRFWQGATAAPLPPTQAAH